MIIAEFNKNLLIIISSKYRSWHIFILSCFLIIVIKCIQFPSLTYNAEMFAENGTNFFIHAYEDDLITNLITTDAGYLPLLQRIAAVLIVKVFNIVDLYAFAGQATAITFIAVMSSILNLKIFRQFCRSDLIRFMLAISVALISDYELNAFINFVYYGLIFLVFGLIVDKEKLNNFLHSLLSLFSALIILSKGQFVVLLPLYFLTVYWHFKRRQYRAFVYFLVVIFSGLFQLWVMYSNVSSSTNLKILNLPYFFLKSVYYFVLSYRHVFAGYITKEQVSIFSIGIITVLVILGLGRVIRKKETAILYFFLIGNFIAFCSLFLTVVFLNNNINPIASKVAAAISEPKSFIAVSGDIASVAFDDARSYKNIFDVKHLANLRSLFISNTLIFVSGVFVLLSIFSKKSHKVVALIILFLISGAFGQIRVEELYPKKAMSYSQWQNYYYLVDRKQYCIPLNPYSLLLKKNCDYLMYIDPQRSTLPYVKQVKSVELSKITSHSKSWEIQAIMLVNRSNKLSDKSLSVFAYDKKSNLIGKARQLVPSYYEYVYYLFDNPIKSVEKLIWKTSGGQDIAIVPNINVLGIDREIPDRKIVY